MQDHPEFALHGTRTGRFRCAKPNLSEQPKSDPRPNSVFKPEDIGAVGVQMSGKTMHGLRAHQLRVMQQLSTRESFGPVCPLLAQALDPAEPNTEGVVMRSTPLCQVPAFRKAVDREFTGTKLSAARFAKHRQVNADFLEKFLPGRHD